MVNTRSRFNRENRNEQSGVDRYSDDDDKMSVADHYAENIFGNEAENDTRAMERDHETKNTKSSSVQMAMLRWLLDEGEYESFGCEVFSFCFCVVVIFLDKKIDNEPS